MNRVSFDWADVAFSSKKELNGLRATFIAAPRELSAGRLTQLIKQYLPKGNIIIGLAKDTHVLGFEGQPQFCMLKEDSVAGLAEKVMNSSSPHKVYILHYFQREQKHVLDKLKLRRVVFVNGSWKYSFHMGESYYTLVRRSIPYELVSPFIDEDEAKSEGVRMMRAAKKALKEPAKNMLLDESAMLSLALDTARLSFDHTFQIGAALAKKHAGKYKPLLRAFNKTVPYETSAWHHGSLRELHFSPPNDLNYYDTAHGEVELVIEAGRQKIDLKNKSVFINLLPCPTCSRMLAETDIAELVYSIDHSDGYGVKLLEAAGKRVRRVVL